ncbi:MAG: DUF368 domain-containing protein [Phycisphaerales bacterium]
MPDHPPPNDNLNEISPVPVARAFIGGVLMGLANLVPGISGGTMLVACGIYRRFIDAISSATRLKLTRNTMLLLFIVIAGAVISIGGLAGLISWALTEHRWMMYSLFIGLTLGGLPIIWKLARPINMHVWIGALLGAAAMGGLVYLQESGTGNGGLSGPFGLVVGGAAAAGAMILPGVSGAFLLLLLGQYEPIIDAIKETISALKGGDIRGVLSQMRTVIPVGIGVVVGVVGVANLLRWLMHRFERLTLGVLIGLLVAAPAGLYPFREGVPPEIGDIIKGSVVTEENLAEQREPSNAKDWAQASYAPSGGRIAGSLALIIGGFGATMGIARIGRDKVAPANGAQSD